MKILLVNDYGRPQGGAEILLINLREAFRRAGHDARLFASDAGDIDVGNVADYTCHGSNTRLRTLVQTFNPWAARRLRQVLSEFQPDVVHVKMFLTQLSPLILPVLRDYPALYHAVWYRAICPLGTKMLPDRTRCYSPPGLVCHRTGCLPWRVWLPLMLQLKLWRRWRPVFKAVIAASEAVRSRLLAEGVGPIEVIHNGIAAEAPRSSLPLSPTIAFAGRLVREKGVDVLLRAFALLKRPLPEAKLVICGDGPERTRIETLIRELNLSDSVSMPGFLPACDVVKTFRQSWVVAVPSVWEEPFGHVAIEAMMNGVPIVVSKSGGLAEIVADGGTGFVVPPNDSEALSSALLKIAGDRQTAETMGRAAHERAVALFSEAELVRRFVNVYRTIGAGSEDAQ
jgi:glycosyltransferase involved in cell wall biosynthesis